METKIVWNALKVTEQRPLLKTDVIRWIVLVVRNSTGGCKERRDPFLTKMVDKVMGPHRIIE